MEKSLVGDTQMDELSHGALQVGLVGEHWELRFVIDTVPNDHIFFAGGLRSSDREEQLPVERDFQETENLFGGKISNGNYLS